MGKIFTMKLKVKLKYEDMHKDLFFLSPVLLTVMSVSTVIIEPNNECSYFIISPCTSENLIAFILFFIQSKYLTASKPVKMYNNEKCFFHKYCKKDEITSTSKKSQNPLLFLSHYEQMIENIFLITTNYTII